MVVADFGSEVEKNWNECISWDFMYDSTSSRVDDLLGMVCLLAAPRVQLSISAGIGWPLQYHQLMSVNSQFRHCEASLVLSHV